MILAPPPLHSPLTFWPLAIANSKGTFIRILNTLDATRLQAVHRGVDKEKIYSLDFSSNHQRLVVSSDKGDNPSSSVSKRSTANIF